MDNQETAPPAVRSAAPPPIVQIKSLEDLQKFSELLAKSSLVPKAYEGKPHDIAVCIMFGHELGLSPIAATQSIAVINGNPGMYGDAPLALVRAKGLLEWIKEEYDEATETWTCRIKRKGEPPDIVYTGKFGMPDARKIEVILRWDKQSNRPVMGKLADKDTYKSHGKRMCQFRARSFPLRDGFSDVLKGLRQAEEFEEFEATAETVSVEPIKMPQRASETGANGNGAKPAAAETKSPQPTADETDQRTPQSEKPEAQSQEPESVDFEDLKAEAEKWINDMPDEELLSHKTTDTLFRRLDPLTGFDDQGKANLANLFMKRKQQVWKKKREASAGQ